jgi:hypothetical protein
MRLVEVVDFADMLGRMGQLEADTPAMPAGREAPALDDGHLVPHVGMHRIVRDPIDTGLRHDLARLLFLRHVVPLGITYRRLPPVEAGLATKSAHSEPT